LKQLRAGSGLALSWDERGGRVEWGTPDWLGPIGLVVRWDGRVWSGPERAAAGCEPLEPEPRELDGEDALGRFRALRVDWDPLPVPIQTSVRAYADRPLLVFRLEAAADLAGLSTGDFAVPSVAWPWLQPARRLAGGVPEGTRGYGHQYTEFALPTWSDPSLEQFFLLPQRPAVVQPLWLAAPDACVMLAPLDAFHEQVIAVPRRGEAAAPGVSCGWQGDLDAVPRGFASELAVWAGPAPRRVLEAWGELLRRRHRTPKRSRYADVGLAKLSYWTDNGAAYWYRTEPGCDVLTSLERALASLRASGIPAHSLQLDSWFYPHQVAREFNDEGAADVPPTGLLTWEPRADVLPDGIAALRRRLGDPPLTLHARHFSSRSPYFERYAGWTDGDRAHPADPELYERLLEQAATWGAATFEQDWLVESFLGVRGLRERAGRARGWQEGMDRAAARHGLTLQFCMASPADFMQTLTLGRVTSIRTSGDYRYLIGSGALWAWFLHTNALARALGLLPFKDVFLSNPRGEGRDGDPQAEAEALLSALSAGPVAIGDRAGRSDPAVVARTCRADGTLVKPDVPIAALERCFAANAFVEPVLLAGETYSQHPAGRWVYLASFNACGRKEPVAARVALSELGVERDVIAYDWRSGRFERLGPRDAIELELAPLDWDLRVLCPVLPNGKGTALFGDVGKYASVGDRRIRGIRAAGGGLSLDVLGAPGERVRVSGWAAQPLERVRTWAASGEGEPESCRRDPDTGGFEIEVEVGPAGSIRLELETG
jgi:hypothetical protein